MPDQIIGDYKIVRLLGSGGLGAVYEAVSTSAPGKRVALKTLHKNYSDHPEIAARFRREAQVGTQLLHPRIVGAFEYGYSEQLGNIAYMVMELVDGESLRQYLSRMGGQLSEEACLGIFEQLADALDFAHKNGVIHRDLKLGNVMILGHPQPNENPLIKVLDFGISKAIGPDYTDIQTADYRSILGTFEYMPPEQFMTPAQVTGHTDVYSLGIMLYYCLTGSLPFKAPESTAPLQLASVYYKLHTSSPPPALPGTVQPALASLVMSMLAKSAGNRPSMAEVRKSILALQKALGGHEAATYVRPADELTKPLAEPSTVVAPASSHGPTKVGNREQLLLIVATIALLWAIAVTAVLLLK